MLAPPTPVTFLPTVPGRKDEDTEGVRVTRLASPTLFTSPAASLPLGVRARDGDDPPPDRCMLNGEATWGRGDGSEIRKAEEPDPLLVVRLMVLSASAAAEAAVRGERGGEPAPCTTSQALA